MKPRRFAAILLVLPCMLFAQAAAAPVVRVAPFTGASVTPGELATFEKLVAGYIAELEAFRVVDRNGRDIGAAAERDGAPIDPLAADYVVSGSVEWIDNRYVLSLETLKARSGERLSVQASAGSVNDLVLKLRDLTRGLFRRPGETDEAPASGTEGSASDIPESGDPAKSFASTPKAARVGFPDVTGVWRSDDDRIVESITILPSGNGIVMTKVGKQVPVRVTIGDGVIELVQSNANNPEIYFLFFPVTREDARKIADASRPWRWVLHLSVDGTTIFGIMESVRISRDGDGIYTIDNEYVREAAFTRK